MDNTIQLYVDKKREVKGYPITSPDRVIDENGVNIKDYVDEAIDNAKLEGGDTQVDLSVYAKKTDLHDHLNKTILDSITTSKVNQWDNKSDFSGNYNDLTNKPTIPTKVSQLTNDTGYIAEHQDISGKVDKVSGYSLVSDTEISRLATLENYDDTEIRELINEINTSLDNINSSMDNINNKQLTFEDFGAIGDGITDDTIAIQSALDWSKENNSAVYMMDKLYYVTNSLRCGNAIIRSINDVPGECDIKFLRRKDGTYMNDTPDWGYMFNTSNQYTWREVIDNCAVAPAIISDKDIKILTIGNGEVFNIRGFAVIGNHKMKNQHGLCDDTPDKYRGTRQSINNINVIGCGNNGITLNRGLEVSTLKNVNCVCNMGHGLYTGLNDFDSATEYLHFENCIFSDNRLDGVHFSYWRKDINFINCQFNGNGQYYINSIDPVLGYDRRQPTELNMVKSGVWCDKGNVEDRDISLGFSMINCYGEESLLGLHMENINGNGVINNVKLENNIFYRGSIPKIDNHNGSCFYININYINNWTVKGNSGHALDILEYGKLPNNGGNNDIGDVTVFPKTFVQDEVNFNNVECKKVISDYVLFQNLAGTGTNVTSDKIKNDFTLFTDNGFGNRVATYTLSAHWQSTNADRFGAYLLIVTIMPSGRYNMLTLATSSVDGFSSVPTISDDGILNIPTQEYYRYTLQRIDITKTS